MKLKIKYALVMFFLSAACVALLSGLFSYFSHRAVLSSAQRELRELVIGEAYVLEFLLVEKAKSVLYMAAAPAITEATVASNRLFGGLSEEQRRLRIEQLDSRWREAPDAHDPFVVEYMSNPSAAHLVRQQTAIPGEIGEIFLTNRYGALIATTAKLTTLAHAHKYWWKAGFSNASGRVFFDDRGYDTSVGDHVLGIVVPVRMDGEVIGILKCNYRVGNFFEIVRRDYRKGDTDTMLIARSNGLIVFDGISEPLKNKLGEDLIALLKARRAGSTVIGGSAGRLTAYAPVAITLGSDAYGFGGSYESVDHIKGNEGEFWALVFSQDMGEILGEYRGIQRWIIVSGSLITLLVALSALVLGSASARPIEQLAESMKKVGAGNLDFEMEIGTRDELGMLAESLNEMISNLKLTTASRDHLLQEIGKREKAEEALKKKEEQLLQSQKMEAIGRLAGGVAHDFNNMLTVILGYCELMLSEKDTGNWTRQEVEEIRDAAQRAIALTAQLLAFSRKQVMQPEIIDLNGKLSVMEDMLARLIGENIELKLFLADGLWRIKVDTSQIEQVVMNLVVNSRDAMPYGGQLTVETKNSTLDEAYENTHAEIEPGDYVLMSVSDTGQGMDRETLSRVFEPFFTTKEKGKGTGLGLSTAYGIVRQSGGYLFAYSEPGKGSTFKIYLPCVEEDLPAESAKPATEAVKRGNENLLLVEDEPSVRDLTCRILRRNGYRVLTAQSGEDAERIASQATSDNVVIRLVITDVVMPGMSGRELVDRLKPLYPDMKALYMSGYTENAIVHHGVLNPDTAFLQKPFSVNDLLAKVRDVLDPS